MTRHHTTPDGNIPFTAEEETARDIEEAAAKAASDDYIANHKYKDDRIEAYPPIGDQLDAIWKGGDDQAAMKVLVDKVKSDNPK
tara:strand:- start:1480 stop:1731 length:252 start_codon:yes stop_codon:yes gene_type:complete